MVDVRLYFITAALYLLLGFGMFRLRSRATAVPILLEHLLQALILGALVIHGLLLQQAIFVGDQLDLSLGHAVSLIAAITVAMYWLVSFRHRMGVLQPLILMLSAAVVLVPLVLPSDKPVSYSGLLAFKVHLVVSLMAYSLFAIAALQAILMGVIERRLHNHQVLQAGLWPSLVAMDSLLFQMILVGFLLLTATLASGVFFSEELFGKPLVFNHKVLFSFIAWFIYAGLLAGRHIWGLRGRRAARWAVVGFAMLLVAYVGSKFVLEVILHRS